MKENSQAYSLPSVDRVLNSSAGKDLHMQYGHVAVVNAIRAVFDDHRLRSRVSDYAVPSIEALTEEIISTLKSRTTPSLRRVYNLTGVVLHTNLGRASISEAAIAHASMAMRDACNLEFDLSNGKRGERDQLIQNLLGELTGAEAATVVNNNAAAVLLVLTALARGREVVLSRSEMIEIGGSFRIPDVMRSAGVRLVEVGTTNRTHPADYENAVGPKTAALMKVHKSNYKITGFTAEVALPSIAEIAHAKALPMIVDLGAGTLVDLAAYGLPPEPIVSETVTAGADIVMFSGDKLLGGPQAGLIVGKKELIKKINRHPLKRALRVSKMTLAALEATLLAYRTPDHLIKTLPTFRLLTRSVDEIATLAGRLQPALTEALGSQWNVSIKPSHGQVGSGSLPLDTIPSVALVLRPTSGKPGSQLNNLTGRMRELPIPIIGRADKDCIVLDLRCLEDERGFLEQIKILAERSSHGGSKPIQR